MLTEVIPTMYTVKVSGKIIGSNIPSRQLAESMVFQLPADQRAVAQIIPTTPEGKTILLG